MKDVERICIKAVFRNNFSGIKFFEDRPLAKLNYVSATWRSTCSKGDIDHKTSFNPFFIIYSTMPSLPAYIIELFNQISKLDIRSSSTSYILSISTTALKSFS